VGQPAGGQAGRRLGRALRSGGPVHGCRREVVDDLAEHELDDPLLRALGHVDHADGLPLSEDGRPIADRGDLDHPVGDEDHAAVTPALPADDLENALGEVRRQGGRHLVEHQDVRLDGEGTGEIDDAPRCQRQLAGQGRQVEALQAELGEPVPERLVRRLGQAEVGPDVEVRDEGRLLVDGDEPAAAGLGRVVDGPLATTHGDPSSVGVDRPGQDLDEGALASPVRAHQRVDLAWSDRERRGPQRDDRTVGLGDAGRLEQQIGGGQGHGYPVDGGVRRGGCRRPASPAKVSGSGRATPRPGPCRRWPARGYRWSSPRS
jgi:hypothetical protein